MSIKQENWDGITAPSIPAGWATDVGIATTSTFLNSILPTSSPNALTFTGGAVNKFATWNVKDSNSGNVLVRANFNASGTLTFRFGLFARSNSSSPTAGASTFYLYELQASNVAEFSRISKVVAGVATVLDSVTLSGWIEPGWFQILFTLSGSSLTVSVQRMSDNFWLTSAGTFGAATANVNSVTDSSINGAGWAGLTLAATGTTAYADDWLFDNAAGSVQSLTPYMHPICRPVTVPEWADRYG